MARTKRELTNATNALYAALATPGTHTVVIGGEMAGSELIRGVLLGIEYAGGSDHLKVLKVDGTALPEGEDLLAQKAGEKEDEKSE